MATIFDLEAINLGSIWCLNANTDDGEKWLDENLHTDPWQKFGESVVVDARMIGDILNGIEDAGLVINIVDEDEL